MASGQTLNALKALVEWGRDNTSPHDADSPHELLIAGVAAIEAEEGVATDFAVVSSDIKEAFSLITDLATSNMIDPRETDPDMADERERQENALALVLANQKKTIAALTRAEAFIAGFEGDEIQEGIEDLLANIRGVIWAMTPAAPKPAPTYYLATIDVLMAVDSDDEACDAISETMRPLLRQFAGSESCIIDWRYAEGCIFPEPHDGSGFEYAETAR